MASEAELRATVTQLDEQTKVLRAKNDVIAGLACDHLQEVDQPENLSMENREAKIREIAVKRGKIRQEFEYPDGIKDR